MNNPVVQRSTVVVATLCALTLSSPFLGACSAHAQAHVSYATGDVVKFNTSDGWTIVGDRYAATGRQIGSVILLHQRGGSASDWAPLAADLQRAGITALAIDQRGTGRSTDGPGPTGPASPWETGEDIAAALRYLNAAGPVGLAGASYGANNALIFAARHPKQIAAIALFSPGENYHGLEALPSAATCMVPTAIYHYKSDEIAGDGPSKIAARMHGNRSLKVYAGSGHGTDLLITPARAACLEFFKQTLSHSR